MRGAASPAEQYRRSVRSVTRRRQLATPPPTPHPPPPRCRPHQGTAGVLLPDPSQTRSIPAVDPTQAQHTCTAHVQQVWPRRARHATLLPVERARVRRRAAARGTDLGGGGATAWSRRARLFACSCRTKTRPACSGLLLSAPAQSRRKRCLLTRRHSRHIETRALSHRCHASGSPPAAAGSYARQACGATCVAAAGDGGQGAARAERDGLRLGGGRGPLCDCNCSVERPPSPGLSGRCPN